MDDWRNWIPSEVKKIDLPEEEIKRREKLAEVYLNKLSEEASKKNKQNGFMEGINNE